MDGSGLVDIGYTRRPQFKDLHLSKNRWAAIVAHRRAGKTVACVIQLLTKCWEAGKLGKREPRFAYIAPTYTQAKDVAWSYVKEYGLAIPGAQANESELRIDFPWGGRIRLYGSDNYDRLRGLYLDGVVLDEYGDMDPRAWPEVIRPALSDRQGWAIFIGTPKGRNHFSEVYDLAKEDSDWLCMMLKASETGLLDEKELADLRKMLSEDQYEQELECSFDAAIQGAYYAKELKRADADGRIGQVPYSTGLDVHTAWDLGIGDSTAIWFCQVVGQERRVIDYYETSGVGLDHYVKVLREKPYVYGQHYLPHDVEVKELGTGQSRLAILKDLGLNNIVVGKRLPVDDGIQSARVFMSQCWFDEKKCKRGLDALRQYCREYDDKLKVFKQRPLHDWTSHAADAFRYLAINFKPTRKKDWDKPLYAETGTIV